MCIVGHFSYLQLLFFLFSRAESIQPLKRGRMVDAEGREYKSPRYEIDKVESAPYSQVNGSSLVRIQCTDSLMNIDVYPDQFRKGSHASFGELFLGGAEHKQKRECHLLPAAEGKYAIQVQLQECGSEATVKRRVTCNLCRPDALPCLRRAPFRVLFCTAGDGGLPDLLKQAVSLAGSKAPQHHQDSLYRRPRCLPLQKVQILVIAASCNLLLYTCLTPDRLEQDTPGQQSHSADGPGRFHPKAAI